MFFLCRLMKRKRFFSMPVILINHWQVLSYFRVGQRGVVVYQYTRKKFAKIPKNTQNSSKYTQNYTQVYFVPEIQRKWYTEYPYLSCNIRYTDLKSPCIPYTQKLWLTLILDWLACQHVTIQVLWYPWRCWVKQTCNLTEIVLCKFSDQCF